MRPFVIAAAATTPLLAPGTPSSSYGSPGGLAASAGYRPIPQNDMKLPTNLPKVESEPVIATWELWTVAQMLVATHGDDAVGTYARTKVIRIS